jgi:hypothetical protein
MGGDAAVIEPLVAFEHGKVFIEDGGVPRRCPQSVALELGCESHTTPPGAPP